MLGWLIRTSLRYRGLVVILSLIVMLYGSYLATTLPIDVFPDLDRPRVVLITECPGLATEEVETLVTQPIETALLGAAGVLNVRSQTASGLNVIFVEFDWNIDVRAARQIVQERLSTVSGQLPAGINPQMTPTSSIMGQIVIAGMYPQVGPGGGTLGQMKEEDLAFELKFDSPTTPTVRAFQVADVRDASTWSELKIEKLMWDNAPPAAGFYTTEAEIHVAGKAHHVEFWGELKQRIELRTLAEWVIRPRLRRIAGVAEVFVQGGDRKQYQILVDPTALQKFDVSLQQVEQALKESNINTSGGFAQRGEEESPIRILGRLGTDSGRLLSDLGEIPVRAQEPLPVLLRNVARIVEGPQAKRGDGAINGRFGVVFTIAKQPHVDTRRLTTEISGALDEIQHTLPANTIVVGDLFQLKNFIDRGIFNVGEALVIGAVLVLIVLFLFLLNLRTTFITLTAIPLSLVITIITFRLISKLTGVELSVNVMTLGGIAVAMGELVDDAIVDVENIFRRLRENSLRPQPKPALQVVYQASQEIRGAIVFGTIIVILAFLPLFALSGIEGRLFTPLGLAYIVSILASLMVSLTITPVLSLFLLPKIATRHAHGDGPIVGLLKSIAAPLIRFSMSHSTALFLGTWGLVAVCGIQMARMGKDFLPKFDEGSIQVNVTLPPGSSLDASNRSASLIDAMLDSHRGSSASPDGFLKSYVRRTGRAEFDEHAQPVNTSEYILSINPAAHSDREETIGRLLADLKQGVPDVDIEVEQPMAHMISHMVSGVYAQISVKVVGDDLDTLIALAERIKSEMKEVPGLTPPVVEPIRQARELSIRLRPDDLARYGLTRAYVASVLQTALQGEVVSQVLEGQRRFDLLVRLEEQYRTDYANLGRLRIDAPDHVRQFELKDLADIDPDSQGPNALNRDNARRRIVIRCNTQGRDLAGAVTELESRLRSRIELPQNYFLEFGGQFESQRSATLWIGLLSIVSAVGMFIVLTILYPSLRIVLQILNALPTAFIGGVIALQLSGQSLTVASLVGFVSLGGIAVRNGILLVTHYFHLMREEHQPFSQEMILRGSLERLSPVLMTALTAGIGLIPLVWGGQEPGREILYPVATVILGGLITSTFCEFLIHPGLFWNFSGRSVERLMAAESERIVES